MPRVGQLGSLNTSPSCAPQRIPRSVSSDFHSLPQTLHCRRFSSAVSTDSAPLPAPALPALPRRVPRGIPRQCVRPSSRILWPSNESRHPNTLPCPLPKVSGMVSWHGDRTHSCATNQKSVSVGRTQTEVAAPQERTSFFLCDSISAGSPRLCRRLATEGRLRILESSGRGLCCPCRGARPSLLGRRRRCFLLGLGTLGHWRG